MRLCESVLIIIRGRLAPILEKALYISESSRDDLTAAKAAAALVFVNGYQLNRREESDRWANLAHSILDRITDRQPRIRAWILQNQGIALCRHRDPNAARPLLEEALALKEAAVGRNHPDVARTVTALAAVMTELGRPHDALQLLDRSIEILTILDPNSALLASAFNDRGEALNALGRHSEAETDFRRALQIVEMQFGPRNNRSADSMEGLGKAAQASGDLDVAVHYLDSALTLRRESEPDQVLVADTEFALARALAARGKQPERARRLASSARAVFAKHDEFVRRDAVRVWLKGRPPVPLSLASERHLGERPTSTMRPSR